MRSTIIIAVAAILLTSCNVKDPIYETAHPERGRITLTTDWTQRGEGVAIPERHHVRVGGDEESRHTFTAHTNDHPGLFTPGTHRLHLWHDAAGITVSGNTASVAQTGNTRAGATIIGNPGWFFSSAMDVEIEADKVHEITATMQQQVRELTLVIEPTGGTTDKIESITASLSGVAGTLDIDNGTHGSPSDVVLTFTKITSGTDAGKWSVTVRLLGIADGAAPRLTGVISFTGGTPADMSFDSDMTADLAAFNDNKTTPLTLGRTVTVYDTTHPEHGKITLTTDWSGRGEGVDIPAGYTVRVGEYSAALSGATNTIDHLFDPGDHTVYVWNPAANITVSGTTATADYTAGLPGWFFTGKTAVAVTADAGSEASVAMTQQVRQLTFTIEPTGGTEERIESITGTLSGVGGTLDIDTGAHGSPSELPLDFTKGTDGKWTATVRLLGMAGAEQKLTGTIAFAGGAPADIPLYSDLTAALAGFNTDKKTPLTLGGQVVETPTGAGFTATITGWDTITRPGVIAD